MGDISTVIWREWREFREQLLSLKRGGLSALVLALILGIVTPAQMGPEWLGSSLMLAYWPFVASSASVRPYFVVTKKTSCFAPRTRTPPR